MAKTSNYLTDKNVRPEQAYLSMTPGCNSRCRHCFMEAGPERQKESMSIGLRRRIIDDLSDNKIVKVYLTGGEVIRPGEFEKLLDTIEYTNKKRVETGYPKYIRVQTNGFFAKNEEDARRVFGELKKRGVDTINISGHDKYHDEQLEALGLEEGAPERAYKVALKFGFDDVSLTGATTKRGDKSTTVAVPLGRAARHVPKNEWDTSKPCYVPENDTVEISYKGDVQLCWNTLLTIGNLGEKPLKTILEEARENETVQQIANFGFRSVPIEKLNTGNKEELDTDFKELGDCGTCYRHSKGLLQASKKEGPWKRMFADFVDGTKQYLENYFQRNQSESGQRTKGKPADIRNRKDPIW